MGFVRVGVVGEDADYVATLVEQKLQALVPDIAKTEKQNARPIFHRTRLSP